jgi:hypothetical protein
VNRVGEMNTSYSFDGVYEPGDVARRNLSTLVRPVGVVITVLARPPQVC